MTGCRARAVVWSTLTAAPVFNFFNRATDGRRGGLRPAAPVVNYREVESRK